MCANRVQFPRPLSLSIAALLLCTFCLTNFPSVRAWMGEAIFHLSMGLLVGLILLMIAMMIFYQRRSAWQSTTVSRGRLFLRRAGVPVAMSFLVLGLLWSRTSLAASMNENFSDFIMGLCFGISIALNILTILANRNNSGDDTKPDGM